MELYKYNGQQIYNLKDWMKMCKIMYMKNKCQGNSYRKEYVYKGKIII